MKFRPALFLVTACIALGACGAETVEVTTTTTTVVPGGPKLPAGVVVGSIDGAKDVGEVKKDAKEGDEVVVRGVVAGDEKPIVAGRAVFMLGDVKKLYLCTEMEGDACKTPWDACCATPDAKSANTLSVQVLGADGQPVAAAVEGDGIVPLATVVVKGKVGPRPDPKVLVINATSVHVEAGPEKYSK